MKKSRIICVLQTVFLLFLVLPAQGVSLAWAAEGIPDSLHSAYPYVRFLAPGDSAVISDDAFYDISGRVVFPVNEFRPPDDAPLLRQLDADVLPWINRSGYQLARMLIRGTASPDGPYGWNERLGQLRAGSLMSFIKDRLTVPVDDDCFQLDVEIEDYRALCFFLSRANDSNYAYVQGLCDKYLPTGQYAELKEALRTAQDGLLWRHLLKNYFPDLRTARVVLFFRKAAPPVEQQAAEPPAAEPEPQAAQHEPLAAEAEPGGMPVAGDGQPLYRREVLAVKTNLLLDAAYVPGYDRWCPIPNVAVEYYPRRGHFTFGASFDCPWWRDYDAHKYFQIRNYQVETRYYLRANNGNGSAEPRRANGAFRGLYLQGYAHLGVFGICFDADRGWVGEGVGAGAGLGYVMPLSRRGHWRLELGLQAGFFRCKYDPYQYENPVDPTYRDHLYYYKWSLDPTLFKKRQYRYNWLGPTRIGVTLTYDLLYRRIGRRGVSFNYKEKEVNP